MEDQQVIFSKIYEKPRMKTADTAFADITVNPNKLLVIKSYWVCIMLCVDLEKWYQAVLILLL